MDDELPAGRYNTAPTDPIRIVIEADGRRRVSVAQWGFRPFWLRDEHKGWINAKAETALESRAFGPALRNRRCVIPADAFYEWRRETRPPQPFAGPLFVRVGGKVHALGVMLAEALHVEAA